MVDGKCWKNKVVEGDSECFILGWWESLGKDLIKVRGWCI